MDKIIIREKYLEKISPFYDSKYIKVITGVRRCGKSELLLQIINEIKNRNIDENHIIVIDLEGKSGEGITNRTKLENKIEKCIKDDKMFQKYLAEEPEVAEVVGTINEEFKNKNISLILYF